MYRWRINRKGITSTQNKLMQEIMKDHIDSLWKTISPRVIGTRELRQKGKHYLKTYKKRGVTMKHVMLADNAQIAIKMIKHGNIIKGVHQLLSVLLVGRSGVHAVWLRFHHIRKGTAAAIRRKVWLSR